MSYLDIKNMTRMERAAFINIHIENVRREQDAIERESRSR
jgi:uncharacterized alkaline shock family protein YloU